MTTLDKKEANKIAFLLHQNQNDTDLINQLMTTYSLENLIKTNNSGLISNLLQFFITKHDDKQIEYIIEISNQKLMKRDYLSLINYYYHTDLIKSIYILENNILSKTLHNNNFIILTKDINYIIENKLFKILEKLEGQFIETSNNDYPLINSEQLDLKLKFIDDEINSRILEDVEKLLPDETKNNLNHLMKNKFRNIEALIDGGNVMHSNQGIINQQSVNNLELLITQVKKTVGNPLIIIHKRHLKIFPNMITSFNLLNVNYYLTNYGMNDDIFILWFFLKTGSKTFIISNDKYRDHIFKFETNKKLINVDFKMSIFNHIIQQQTLGFDIKDFKINPKPKHSKCIYLQNEKIYVPHVSGSFAEII